MFTGAAQLLGSAGPLFSQSMTHTAPSAVAKTLSAHRSR